MSGCDMSIARLYGVRCELIGLDWIGVWMRMRMRMSVSFGDCKVRINNADIWIPAAVEKSKGFTLSMKVCPDPDEALNNPRFLPRA